MRKLGFVAGLGLFVPALAFAQTDGGDHHVDDGTNEIVVTGVLRRDVIDVLGGVSVVTKEELIRDLRPTIGDTLARQAGVSATSFGPNASRPILRGFQGERVRVLADGIGSFDVSNTSVDHAVAINTLNADRIEVLRGPAALLYGSSAIGGVVNVIDSRIPRRAPDEKVHVDAVASYGSAAKERSGAGRFDLAITRNLIAHVDASYNKTSNLRIGGFALSPALRQTALASGDPDIAEAAAIRGRLPNSDGRMWEVAGGLAWVGDNANFGGSVTRYDNLYAIPVRYATSVGEEAEAVRLDARQMRYDVRGEIEPDSAFIYAVRLRGGHANYRHAELDEVGEVGTRFFSKGTEARLEIEQLKRGIWSGAIGAQALRRTLSIIGDEKFLPPSTSQQFGLFALQSLDFGRARLEGGGRIEFSKAQARADVQLGNPNLKRKFTAVSASLGGNWEFADSWKIGANFALSTRAPSVEELFPNGPHVGTQAFEIGNPTLKLERSKGIELNLRSRGDGYSVNLGVFKSWFTGFIYDLPNGDIEDGLPVFEFLQNKARYSGAELEINKRLFALKNTSINLNAVADYTRATIIDGATRFAAPRIPPLRLIAGIEAKSSKFDAQAEVEWASKQTRTAPVETATPSYLLTNLSVSFRPWGTARDISLSLSANNIFDVVARRHSSLLKDYAPLAGRDFRVSLRIGL